MRVPSVGHGLAAAVLPVALTAGFASAQATGPGAQSVIAFVRSTGGGENGAPVRFGVWSARADGRQVRLIARGAGPLVWAPDGRRLLFTRSSTRQSSLWIVDADGSNVRRLAGDTTAGSWLPDGTAITFGRRTAPNRYQIYRLDLRSGARPRKLMLLPGPPVWSSDGARLAYVGSRGLFIARADGRRRRFLGPANSIPAWSPEGRRLLYARGTGAICVNRLTRASNRCFTPPGSAFSPSWSPDGRLVVYSAFEGASLQVARPDGTHRRRLFTSRMLFPHAADGRLEAPAWRPRPQP
jgi:Tol biopolymer transport system component